jgi:hypothetical protein
MWDHYRLSQAPSASPLFSKMAKKLSHTLVLSDDPIAGHSLMTELYKQLMVYNASKGVWYTATLVESVRWYRFLVLTA